MKDSPPPEISDQLSDDRSVDTEDKDKDKVTVPIDASTILVINFGSLYLRIGRASDSSPISVPNVIARRNRSNRVPPVRDPCLVPINPLSKDIINTLNESKNSMISSLSSLFPKIVANESVITDFNKRSKPIVLTKSEKTWSQPEDKDVLVANDVMYSRECHNFHIRWPIRRGRLNVNKNLCGSLSCVVSDLQTICSKVIESELGIPLNQLVDYRVVLIIPDVYDRNHIKYLIQMLLIELRFQSCILMHEAVCATFGAGLSHACVVDVGQYDSEVTLLDIKVINCLKKGDQKTSICCIEDGFGSKNTRLTLDFGGSDITQLFHHLIKQRGFPYECNANTNSGAMFLQELKTKLCHVNTDVIGHREKHFRVDLPEQPVLNYKVLIGEECLLAPLGLFSPDMFALTLSGGKRMHVLQPNDGHSDDPFDDNYLIQTKRKYGENSEGTEQVIEDELDGCDVSHSEKDFNFNSDQKLLSLDQAILHCIDNCESDDLKKRLYSSVLLVGGGLAFAGLDKWLLRRLSSQLPHHFSGHPIEIISRPKDISPLMVSWKGAAVMAVLDSAQDMWITRDEWPKSGLKLLREKASFVF